MHDVCLLISKNRKGYTFQTEKGQVRLEQTWWRDRAERARCRERQRLGGHCTAGFCNDVFIEAFSIFMRSSPFSTGYAHRVLGFRPAYWSPLKTAAFCHAFFLLLKPPLEAREWECAASDSAPPLIPRRWRPMYHYQSPQLLVDGWMATITEPPWPLWWLVVHGSPRDCDRPNRCQEANLKYECTVRTSSGSRLPGMFSLVAQLSMAQRIALIKFAPWPLCVSTQ